MNLTFHLLVPFAIFMINQQDLRCVHGWQTEADVADRKEELAQALFDHIPVGVGSQGIIATNTKDLDTILEMGMDYSVREVVNQSLLCALLIVPGTSVRPRLAVTRGLAATLLLAGCWHRLQSASQTCGWSWLFSASRRHKGKTPQGRAKLVRHTWIVHQ